VDDEMHLITKVIMTVLGIAALVLTTWMSFIAFVGGTMPVLGWETEGGFGYGIFWIIVVDPIVLTVALWVSLLISAPFIILFERPWRS